MTTPMMPQETGAERVARLRADFAKIAAADLAPEMRRAVTARYLERERITPEEELAAMPRTLMDEVRGTAQAIAQGGTFNFGDEIVAGARAMMGEDFGTALADERKSLADFRAANPKAAFALEAGSGIATGVGAARAVPLLRTMAAARPLATAAAGGAVAGAGAGESTAGRVGMAAVGAVAAPLVTAGVQKVATSRIGDAMIDGWRGMVNTMTDGGQIPPALRGMAPPSPVTAPSVGATTPGTALVRVNQPTPPTATPRLRSNLPARQGAAMTAPSGGEVLPATPSVAPSLGSPISTPAPSMSSAMDTPRLRTTPGRRLAARMLLDDKGRPDAAIRALGEFDQVGMGDDVTLLNTGDRTLANRARALANAPMSTADATLDASLARQGSRMGVKVGQDIEVATGMGDLPGPVRVKAMQTELSKRVSDTYDAFRARGDVLEGVAGDDAQKLAAFLGDKDTADIFAKYVNDVRRLSPTLRGRSATDADVLLSAFQDVQADLRKAGRGTDNAGATRMLQDLRGRVLDALEQVDPEIGRVTRQYAMDDQVGKVVQDAFETGATIPSAPVGTFTAATMGEPPMVAEAMRLGTATQLRAKARDMASNLDLGKLAKFRDVAGNMAGSQGFADRFREVFGEQQYRTLMSRLSPKIQAAALNAVVRGNSTTARQMLAAMAEGEQAVLDALQQSATGGPLSALATFGAKRIIAPMRGAVTGEIGDAASEAAQLVATRGSKRGEKVLRALEEIAKRDRTRQAATRPASGAVTRSTLSRTP